MSKEYLLTFRLLANLLSYICSNQFASACFLIVSCPPAQVEARRLVTAGHGPVTSGLPVRGHACHAQSRCCRSGHGRHSVGPAARDPTARMSLKDRSPARSEGDRSVGLGSPRPLEPHVAAQPRQLRCRRVLAATLRSRLRVTAATAPGRRPRSARWNRLRLEGPLARSEAVGHCSPGPLEPLAAAPLRCR
jgi:hypothetical protein